MLKPQTCQNCGENKPLDLANISGKYLRKLSDFEWLCRKCHMTKDGRLENTKLTRFKPGHTFWLGKSRPQVTKERISQRVKLLWQDPEYRKHMVEVHKKTQQVKHFLNKII